MDIDLYYLMDNVYGYLATAGIYAAIVGIVILIARQILNKKIGKKYLCMLWLIFIVKLIIPFAPESSFSIFNEIPFLKNDIPTTFEDIFYRNKNYDTQIYSVDNLNDYEDLSKNEAEVVEHTDNNKQTSDENFKYNIEQNSNNNGLVSSFDILDLILIIEFLMILAYAFMYFKFNKKINIYQRNCDRIDDIFKNTLKRMNINKKIDLIITDSVNTPSIIGILKVKVLLPSNLIDLDDSQLEYIFLHELCHYKRKDNIFNYLLVFLQCLHITNAVVWISFKKIRDDIELACDEKVLSILNKEEHNKYGLTILDVLERINCNKSMVLGLSMVSDKEVIKSRLEIIKKFKNLKHKKILALVSIVSVLVLASVSLTNGEVLVDQEEFENSYIDRLFENKVDYIESEDSIEFLLHEINCTQRDGPLELSCSVYPINSIKFIDKKNHSSFMITYETNHIDLSDMENNLYKDSAIMFTLIKNLNEVDYNIIIKDDNNVRIEDRKKYQFNFKRKDIEAKLNIKLNDIEYDKYDEFLIALSSSTEGESSLNNAIEKYLYNKSSLLSKDAFYYAFALNEEDFGSFSEFETTSYAIIGKDEDDKTVTVYLLYVIGVFSFEDDKFILSEDSEIVPVRLRFSKNKNGQYSLIEEKYIQNYGNYIFSRSKAVVFQKDSILISLSDYIRQVFPKEESYKAIYGDYENKLGRELEKNAKRYLESINSDAKIELSNYYDDDSSFNISEDAYNKLYDISLINKYPLIKDSCKGFENGKVYIYESKQDGNILIFTKYNAYRDKILERIKLKVDGDEVTVIEE
ncbi:M56 family metallopeptidase [Intestinibacter sp.]|uniref:M56 family metallopeptidase n=1 Tax=Intestinibacter sp. TaxID=1965304 RepID=UPI003F14319C